MVLIFSFQPEREGEREECCLSSSSSSSTTTTTTTRLVDSVFPSMGTVKTDPWQRFQRAEREKRFRHGSVGGGSSVSAETCVGDLPESVLVTCFGFISETRTRNSVALVCRDWCRLERATRKQIAVRGNIRDLYLIPNSFTAVDCLDLSLCSPWGYSIFQFTMAGALIGQLLRQAFPHVRDMTVYVRDGRDIEMVSFLWPDLESLKLIRWHPRSTPAEATELRFLMQHCKQLVNLDLSQFYCWTEDVPPALLEEPVASALLRRLDLLKVSPEGFKASELAAISGVCTGLEELFVVCRFNPRHLDSVSDDSLNTLAQNCGQLRVLKLVDESMFGAPHGDPAVGRMAMQEGGITRIGFESLLRLLLFLEELAIVLAQSVDDGGLVVEPLVPPRCFYLRSLHLGHFQGVCQGPHPDGIALLPSLTHLLIENCADLNDRGLIAIACGCPHLTKLGLRACRDISASGLESTASILAPTLVDVEVSCCLQFDTALTLLALLPIRSTLQRLHLDCLWDEKLLEEEEERQKELNSLSAMASRITSLPISSAEDHLDRIELSLSISRSQAEIGNSSRKGSKPLPLLDNTWLTLGGSSNNNSLTNTQEWGNRRDQSWSSLNYLSLWIPVGKSLAPLPIAGLRSCPSLREMKIKVEGDCRRLMRPKERMCGLATLASFPALSKLELNCSEVLGYALSAPVGHMDLTLWERWYLNGIRALEELVELDYWPPQDRDLHRRGLSLAGAGLLSECALLRRLVVHGTIQEHFMLMLLRNPNLRDLQIRSDYYPAPEDELTTEMRTDSCQRFETALAKRGFPD